VPADLDLVTFPQVASQRGTAQPVEQVLATGRRCCSTWRSPWVRRRCPRLRGVRRHQRKWLCGPRGVGFAVVPPAVQETLAEPPTLAPALGTGMRRWEAQEAHVAGRVGLAVAAQQWEPGLLGPVRERAAQARAVLDGVAGWRVREPVAEPTGITTLVGGDPFATRAGLLEDGFITSAIPSAAPTTSTARCCGSRRLPGSRPPAGGAGRGPGPSYEVGSGPVTDLQQGPLHDRHVALGAKLADFGGWEMPIEYPGGGVLKEHARCARRSGSST
jgi:hypothetical protein